MSKLKLRLKSILKNSKYTTIGKDNAIIHHPLDDVYTSLDQLYYIQFMLRLYDKTDSETYNKTIECIEYLQSNYVRPYFVDEMCMKYIRNGHEPPRELIELNKNKNLE